MWFDPGAEILQAELETFLASNGQRKPTAPKLHSTPVGPSNLRLKSTAKLLVQYGSHPQCFAPPAMWCLQSCYRAEKWAQESSMAGAWCCCFFPNVRWQDHMLGNKNDYLPGHQIHLYGYVQYIPMMFEIAFMMVGWSYTMTIACKLTMAYNISSQIPWYDMPL